MPALCVIAAMFFAGQARAQDTKGASGLPLPRFVSLKADRVNIRVGPGRQYRIAWVFRRAGLPVEILREHKGWRQVRDSVGDTGWVNRIMLSGRRTALVMAWPKEGVGRRKVDTNGGGVALHAGRRRSSEVIAVVEPGVIASIDRCDGSWCRVTVGKFNGYVPQRVLWGVYPREVLN